ncbi:ribosomal protection-like ABC-F family protein [Sutcliffiella rhizosphaerae]|uniref:Energy-dependent translational throttle protein EttA n=1 Tax=Sutcliffiella rhizosphaerae TaxID=2880967 RepID=A0ABM8YR16_9BACI|nr:ABC-F type ribosomal protection protein [Sutcliffiella rhizosphaerae]CAG9622437.1 Energy-dependent translational throttle protein EttA [Sutcliffiella rhizosphaerae]
MLCTLNNITKSFAGTLIFENISLDIQEKDRIGLVGRNGSGKTTLFQLISGNETHDSGAIHLKKETNIGYLAQIPSFPKGTTAEEVLLSAFSEVIKLQHKLREFELLMSLHQDEVTMAKIMSEYGSIQESFAFLGGYEIESSIQKIANGLKISSLLSQDFSSLSGGEQTKICLGFILLQQPDLLLLDEPTNHLDIFSVEWLEQYLNEYDGTVVVISHDRYFLDEVATKIFDMEDGEVHIYHTNYSGFIKEKEERLLLEFAVYQEQQKKIKKMRETIKRLKEWANQSNPPNAGLHRRAKSMEKALDRMEKVKRPILERKAMGLHFDSRDRSGKDVILLEDVNMTFSEKRLLQDVNLAVYYKERAAIVGQNGTGKSTILKIILGQLSPDCGVVKLGSNVKIGYLSQHIKPTNPNQSLIDAFREDISITLEQARHVLAKFLFYGPAVFKKVNSLSGGEKMRLRLAQLMHQDINLLILDEPTNHLDIDSREVLEEALEDFNGTILAVSHDRYFLNKYFEKTCWLENHAIVTYEGNYQYARGKRTEKQALSITKSKMVTTKPTLPQQKNETQMEPLSSERLEHQLENVENEIFILEEKMSMENDLTSLQKMQAELITKEVERERLYEKLEDVL